MPRHTMLLLAAALLYPAHAAAQPGTTPRKQTRAVARGMTPAQVRQSLGEPVHVRREGGATYMEYANGCRGCTNDYVVIRDCRVVDARFENPSRRMLAAPAPDASAPPADECRVAASEPAGDPGAVAIAPPSGPAPAASGDGAPAIAPPAASAGGAPADGAAVRTPSPPRDTGPGGMAPVAPAVMRPPLQDTVPDPRSADQWRDYFILRRPVTRTLAVPAASISSPTAFGVEMGEGFAGVAYQARTRFTDINDGAAVIGIGLGYRRVVALEVAASSYSTFRGGGPWETGGLNFKLHHAFSDQLGVAVGWENAVSWGGSDAGNSPFAVVTRVFRLHEDTRRPFSAVSATLGVGAGRFRGESAVVDGSDTPNLFGALGFQIAEPVSLTADWSGQDLYAGISVAPIRRVPLLVNAGFADITGSAGDGARFIASASVGFRWLPRLHPLPRD